MQIEYGSDLQYINFFKESTQLSIQEIYPQSQLFFSGRSALFSLIQSGIKLYNWNKIYLPDYYCHDVDEFIKDLPISICYYNDGPYSDELIDDVGAIDKSTNAVVHVNYFGFGKRSRLSFANAFIIEDHTHDLASDWALNSTAHYCFASLRKSLPVPAGGIIWSPQKLELPESPPESQTSNSAVFMKLSAMLLKKNYLEKGNIDKQNFRDLYLNSELLFEKQETNAALPLIIHSLINKIPIEILRAHKTNNFKKLSEAIKIKKIIWQRKISGNQCPFSFILCFENEEKRNTMKKYLIENNIYPAVLWPHQKQIKAKEFSAKVLFVHCDIRYSLADMSYLAEIINNYKHAV